MFITIQFPLFDNRFLKTDPNCIQLPNWLAPHQKARVRYFGEIIDRNKPYLGPWDDEKKYCSAKSVINLCGKKADNEFYNALYNSAAGSRILFRRFQSDGKCMAKFETGFNDFFEDTLRLNPPAPSDSKAVIIAHLQKYILCPTKIKVGNKLAPFHPLIESGNNLRSAYFWATTKGRKTFDIKDMGQDVESFDPVILAHVDPTIINLEQLESEKVQIPELTNQGINIYSLHVPYLIDRRRYRVKTWLIAAQRDLATNAVYPAEFKYYNESIRNLRINLLRIHVDTILQKKLTENFNNAPEDYKINNPALRDKICFYLHKIILNLSKIKRNRQDQQQLVEAAFQLDEKYNGADSLEERIEGLTYYRDWLKTLDFTPENGQVIEFVDRSKADLVHKQSELAKRNQAFISYNHNDQQTAFKLRDKLEAAGVQVLLDSDDMLAGTRIADFIRNSVKQSQATIMLVSHDSLLSGWVGVETVNTLSFQQFFPEKKLIAGYLDKSFLNKNFVDDATAQIDVRLDEINKSYLTRFEKKIQTTDLDDEKNRLQSLRFHLPSIVSFLKNNLDLDFEAEAFDTSFAKLVVAINS